MNTIPQRGSNGIALWALTIGGLWLTMLACTAWEPVILDGWNCHFAQQAGELSVDKLWGLAKYNYWHNNPRIGQVFTAAMFLPRLHMLVTPLLEISLLLLMWAHALGRWPRMRSVHDAAGFVLLCSLVFVAVFNIGPMLFYRPYTGNYVLGPTMYLVLLWPYRRCLAGAEPNQRWVSLWIIPWGVLCGLTNEHTGPAFILTITAMLTLELRRGHRLKFWMLAGLVALIVGYTALYFAPGQQERYSGLAQQHSLLGRIVARGTIANLHVLALPLLSALVLAPVGLYAHYVRRRARLPALAPSVRMVGIGAFVAGCLINATLLASPKTGYRLYFATVVLWVIATMAYVAPMFDLAHVRRWTTTIAGGVVMVSALWLTQVYYRLHIAFADRSVRLHQAVPGDELAVPPLPRTSMHWFIGDDFHFSLSAKRIVCTHYQLDRITLLP